MLNGKKIILGITGSIAAYKSAMLARILVKAGAEVQVIMTPCAKEFITPLTMSSLTGRPVLIDFFEHKNGSWNSHVELGIWADFMVIAPATANTLAKMATGICDNLLLTTYLSARCQTIIAPAMDLDMFSHITTSENISKLKARGVVVIEPSSGELASGLNGKGRMEEPENIVSKIALLSKNKQDLINKKVLVTAGPTYEHIDPVRFIGNHSSGKMGFALAEELANRGAEVTLISGPVSIKTENKNIKRIDVITADEMFNQSVETFPKCDVAIMCAAVADYKPINTTTQKLKRTAESISIDLTPTQDIAKHLGSIKKENQRLVGFALETNNEIENSKQKLSSKNLDFIVLNSLNEKGAGFKHDTNKVSIFFNDGKVIPFEMKLKKDVAHDIVDALVSIM